MEIKLGHMNANEGLLRRKGDLYVEVWGHTNKPASDGIGRTTAYEPIFMMTFKEMAVLTAGIIGIAIPITKALIR